MVAEESSLDSANIILSTDTLSGYGLDLIFQLASDTGFDGIDLAMWKSFDNRNFSYVKKLVEKYDLPVYVIQVSNNVNSKEMNQAVDMAKELGVHNITINAPQITNYRAYNFISKNIGAYKRHNPNIKFSIINPPKSSFFMLPIPNYYFTNIAEIIKKYKSYIGFDIANVDENMLETNFLRNISKFIPYINVTYISDKTKTGDSHVPLGEGSLKLPTVFKKFKQNEYFGFFSLKLSLSKSDLSDLNKLEHILKKCKMYYNENYKDLVFK